MELPELRMCFADGGSLASELEQNLRHSRAFLPGQHDIEVLSECVLVLVHPDHGAEFRLSAQVVMVSPSGTGIAPIRSMLLANAERSNPRPATQ